MLPDAIAFHSSSSSSAGPMRGAGMPTSAAVRRTAAIRRSSESMTLRQDMAANGIGAGGLANKWSRFGRSGSSGVS